MPDTLSFQLLELCLLRSFVGVTKLKSAFPKLFLNMAEFFFFVHFGLHVHLRPSWTKNIDKWGPMDGFNQDFMHLALLQRTNSFPHQNDFYFCCSHCVFVRKVLRSELLHSSHFHLYHLTIRAQWLLKREPKPFFSISMLLLALLILHLSRTWHS